MAKMYQMLSKENVASVRDVQRNPSRALRGITRVMRGSKTVGFFFSNDEFDELLEDVEAAGSKSLRARVREARAGLKKGDTVTLSSLSAKYGI